MSNGILPIRIRTPRGAETVEYQLGELAFLGQMERYGLTSTKEELRGDNPGTPSLVIEGHTTKPGHRFQFVIAFKYEPDKDLDRDGVPYGFHFVGGAVRLASPPPGMRGDQSVRALNDFTSAIRNGEDAFIRSRQFAIRATAAVDQAAAAMRDRGELR